MREDIVAQLFPETIEEEPLKLDACREASEFLDGIDVVENMSILGANTSSKDMFDMTKIQEWEAALRQLVEGK